MMILRVSKHNSPKNSKIAAPRTLSACDDSGGEVPASHTTRVVVTSLCHLCFHLRSMTRGGGHGPRAKRPKIGIRRDDEHDISTMFGRAQAQDEEADEEAVPLQQPRVFLH